MGKLAAYTPNDDLFIGRIRETFSGATQWDKRGLIADSIVTAQNCGFVKMDSEEGERLIYIGIAGTTSERGVQYHELVEYYDQIIDLVVEYLTESTEGGIQRIGTAKGFGRGRSPLKSHPRIR
jgi:hypothetical protein